MPRPRSASRGDRDSERDRDDDEGITRLTMRKSAKGEGSALGLDKGEDSSKDK